ncbi:hypothetical protein [uncultured Duncaniella sp.]|uniref:hypothetical protein n=1 Tax=uncultured Duncaniella sp. TaxID=2768039 RepID=UPI0026287A2D|nr:hypothetical protein [uncultured Duncaniella sp.]
MKRYVAASKGVRMASGSVPAPFNEFYEKVSPKELADGLGCSVNELPQASLVDRWCEHLFWLWPKEEYVGTALAESELSWAEAIYESDNDQVSVVQAIGTRVYPVDIEQVRSLVEQ